MRRLLFLTLLTLLAALPAAAAACERPLLMEGKTTLYQRVLTRPGAEALDAPDGGKLQDLTTFSRLFVYERERQAGREWLLLGTDDHCDNQIGWVDATLTVPWKQQLTLALTNPANRGRLLFFRDWQTLKTLLDSPDPAAAARAIAAGIDAGVREPGVVAVEPETYVDLHQRFYLLPVLDIERYTTPAGRKVRGLQIASVARPMPGSREPEPEADEEALREFRAAIVFVVDATISMQPYIDETRDAVTHFYDRIKQAGLLDKVRFGLVGYRAKSRDFAKNRELEYVSRVFADPMEVDSVSDFMARIAGFREAGVSTDFFDEDAYAGVQAALEIDGWTDAFAARHVVLITDAGALDGTQYRGDRRVQSSTRLDARSLQSMAARRGVALTVMHLQTDQARLADNVDKAEEQYRILAENPRFSRAYHAVPGGSREGFREAIDAFANAVIAQIEAASEGKVLRRARPPRRPDEVQQQSPEEIAASLGHAMLLAYLGERRKTGAPEVFKAWVVDADLVNPGVNTVEPHVLMSRDQLSDLREIVTAVVERAEVSMVDETDTEAFYDQLQSISAWFSRREGGRSGDDVTALGERGLLLEYITGLPYKSDVLNLLQDDWTRWGIQRQSEFIDRMKKKANLYQRYYETLDGWIDIAQTGDSYTRESVYPVPLRDLP